MLRWIVLVLMICRQVLCGSDLNPEAEIVRAVTQIVPKTNDPIELGKLIALVSLSKQSPEDLLDILMAHPELQKAYFQCKNPVRYQMLPDVLVLASRQGQLSSMNLYRSLFELPNLVYFAGHLNAETARHYVMDVYQFYGALEQILQNPHDGFFFINGVALLNFLSHHSMRISKSPLAMQINTLVLPWVNSHPALLRYFISRPYLLRLVHPGGFEVLFRMACANGAADVVEFYLESPFLFQKLSKESLFNGMSLAIGFGHIDVVNRIQSSSRVFQDFSQQDLASLYVLAFQDSKILDKLIMSRTMNLFVQKATWRQVFAAAVDQHRADIQSQLFAVPRIQNALKIDEKHVPWKPFLSGSHSGDEMDDGLANLSYGQLVDRWKSVYSSGDVKLIERLGHLIKAKEISLGIPHLLH